jgi:hypothetical protein
VNSGKRNYSKSCLSGVLVAKCRRTVLFADELLTPLDSTYVGCRARNIRFSKRKVQENWLRTRWLCAVHEVTHSGDCLKQPFLVEMAASVGSGGGKQRNTPSYTRSVSFPLQIDDSAMKLDFQRLRPHKQNIPLDWILQLVWSYSWSASLRT